MALTIQDRVQAVCELAEEMGLVCLVPTGEGEEKRYKAFTKADARKIIDSEDARNEAALLKRDSIKTSYGTVKTHHRNERMARNPRNKEQAPFKVPEKDIIKVEVNTRFNEQLNPHLIKDKK